MLAGESLVVKPTRWIRFFMLAALIAAASPLVAVFVKGLTLTRTADMLAIASMVGVVGLLLAAPALLCAAMLERGRARRSMVVGVVCCAAAFACWAIVPLMPRTTRLGETLVGSVRIAATWLSAAGASLGVAATMIAHPQPLRVGRALRAATIVVAAATGAFVAGAVTWIEFHPSVLRRDDATLFRLVLTGEALLACVSLGMFCTVVAAAWPLLVGGDPVHHGATVVSGARREAFDPSVVAPQGGALARSPETDASSDFSVDARPDALPDTLPDPLSDVSVREHAISAAPRGAARPSTVRARCPRCAEWHVLPLGGAACGSCGLRIRVEAA